MPNLKDIILLDKAEQIRLFKKLEYSELIELADAALDSLLNQVEALPALILDGLDKHLDNPNHPSKDEAELVIQKLRRMT